MARDVWILVLHNVSKDKPAAMEVISKAAGKYIKHYKVSKKRQFSNNVARDKELSTLVKANVVKTNPFEVEDDDSGSLRNVKRSDRLLIIGHGNHLGIAGLGPHEVAALLHWHGMRQAGEVWFMACDVGQGDFLQQFQKAMEKSKVDLGWTMGYTGGSETKKSGLLQTPKEVIADKHLLVDVGHGLVAKEKTKVRVVEVKGNLWQHVKEPKTDTGKRLKVVEYTGDFKGESFALATTPGRLPPVKITKPNFSGSDWEELKTEKSTELVDLGDYSVELDDF